MVTATSLRTPDFVATATLLQATYEKKDKNTRIIRFLSSRYGHSNITMSYVCMDKKLKLQNTVLISMTMLWSHAY